MRRLDTMLFPGGKSRACTLSYDDGITQDRRLVETLNRHGLKATFNLNAGFLQGPGSCPPAEGFVTYLAQEEVPALYEGHEVGGHGLWHSAPTAIGSGAAMYEVIEDKRRLEALTGRLVRTFAYPFGLLNDDTVAILRLAGYESARTVEATCSLALPEDFLRWNPSCHHKNPGLMALARQLCEEAPPFPRAQLLYVWGHSYEFDMDDNWPVIEEFAAYMGGFADSVWFATNGEVCAYVKAFRQLVYSADAGLVHNPTAQTLHLGINGEAHTLAPGETIRTA